MEEKIDEYMRKIEAILFVAGKRLPLDEIARLARIRDREEVKKALEKLKAEYDEKKGSLIIDMIEQGDETLWKLTVQSQMIPLIKRIVTKTELKKSVIETLAYIAYKYPIKQSDLIKVRSNKAYEHLSELDKTGYISRQKYGRTNIIKLTEKFFNYFDLPPEKLKDQFKDFAQLEKTIEEKEAEVKKIIQENKEKTEEIKKERQEETKEGESLEPDLEQIEIDLIDNKGHKKKLKMYEESEKEESKMSKIETYEGTPSGKVEVVDEKEPEIAEVEEKLGELDVIDEPIPELAEQIKKKKEEEKEEHLGKLEVFKEKEAGEITENSKEEAEVQDEEAIVKPKNDWAKNGAEKKAEPEEAKEKKEITIEEEMQLQKEKLQPESGAKFGPGFTKEVQDYMEEKAEERVEEIMHPEKEEEKEEDISEKIKLPPTHGKEEEKEVIEEPAEEKAEAEETPAEEEKENLIEKKESLLKPKEAENMAELPPMDTFEEEKEKPEAKPEDEKSKIAKKKK